MSVEILLPAGSYENFLVAVNNGADAVYIGGSSFSARANATNFTDDEIAEAVKYAHIRGVKVYVALNTLVEDNRFSDAYDFAKFCYECGVDALIVQDLGILSMLRESFPDMKLNASTQLTVHNLKGVRAAERAGFSRIVLSRELSKEEIEDICDGAESEIEVFAHGALCMSYSGQCLMSSFIGGRSGNRGACAQPCRLPYGLIDADGNEVCDGKYLLSLKDLCLLDEIGRLDKLGVTSLKIEGRMKNSSYVAMTSHLYDKYRDGGKVDKQDIEDLQSVFSRNGFTKGYFENSTGRHMLNIDRNNDDVYKNISDRAMKRAEELANSHGNTVSISGSFTAYLGEPATLCVWDDKGHSATFTGNIPVEKAIKVPLTHERIREQMSKTGGTPFEFDDFIINTDEGISIPIKEINELRRSALDEMQNQLALRPARRDAKDFSFNVIKGNDSHMEYTAYVMTYDQAKAAEKTDVARIYIPKNVYDAHPDDFLSDRYFVSLPAIERFGKTAGAYERISTSNFSQIFDNVAVKHGGFRMNVYNSVAVKYLKNAGFDSVCLSPEMNLGQIGNVSKDIPTEIMAYGYLPAMTVQNCVIKSAYDKCICDGKVHYLKDRMGALFPVVPDRDSCTNIILNSAPVYMGDKTDDLRRSGVAFANLYFTIEDAEDIAYITDLYKNGKPFGKNFTRGHFYRGV
ncbi:MAG: U32 family peptidase [Clostridia bacterium]|nr:U32 family peptidase [Clostridia bacterium]